MASRWEGVRLPRASGEVPGLPQKFPELPWKFFGRLPRKGSLTVDFKKQSRGSPEVPQTPPGGVPGTSPDFSGGQPFSLGSLTPSPDSQKLSLSCQGPCTKTFPEWQLGSARAHNTVGRPLDHRSKLVKECFSKKAKDPQPGQNDRPNRPVFESNLTGM